MATKITVNNYEVKEVTNPKSAPGTEAGLLEKRICGDPVLYADTESEGEIDKNLGKIDISAAPDIDDKECEEKAEAEARRMAHAAGLESEEVPVELEPKPGSEDKPDKPGKPDQGLPGGKPGRPDNTLPGGGARPDNTLPGGGAQPKPGQPDKKK